MSRSSLSLRLVSVLILAACSSNESAQHSAGAEHAAGAPHHWGYGAEGGPSHWCDLDASNAACCQGHEQSPIDIASASATNDPSPKLALVDPPSAFGVANNGHTVQATLQPGGASCSLTLGGARYDLQQFHVHAPSEHAIDGKHSPLELHFVHKSKEGNLAVVGVLVEQGAANAEIEKVWKLAPAHAGDGGVASAVDLANLLPGPRINFRYPGSLTTPPCSEHVQWIVMGTPITMSKEQIERIQGLFQGAEFPHGNARPVQPLGLRRVVVDSGS